MCLAIFKPAGLDIPEENLKQGFDSNNDGCGICWAQDGQLHIEKGMMTFDDFYGIYQGVKEFPMLIHFRKSTHGKKNEDNCHPFLFNDGKLALIHNGVIPIKCTENDYSDTWHFVHKVLDPIVSQRGVPITDQSLSWFIRVSIGTDKIAVMDGDGHVIIFNEDKGNWEDTDGLDGKKGKVWYSNYSFRNYKTYKSYSGSGYSSYHNTSHHQSSIPGSQQHSSASSDGTEIWPGYQYDSSKPAGSSNQPLNTNHEIATDENRGPGKMTEYGWFDDEIEAEITKAREESHLDREEAIIQVFNNA